HPDLHSFPTRRSSDLNQICRQAAAEEKQIGTPTSPGEIASKGPKLRAALDQGIAKAEKLKPPSELKSAADKFVAETKQLSSLLGQIIDVAKKNELAKLVPLGAQAQALGKDAAAVGRSLGAPACALAPG